MTSLPVGAAITALSHRLRLLDRPGIIKPHVRPIPYTGGAMIALSLLLVGPWLRVPMLAFVGIGLAWLVGFIDDVRGLRPELKVAAGIPALALGSFAIDLPPAERLAAVAVGAVFINIFNVIDGLDGLAGGTAAIGLAALLVFPTSLYTLTLAALGCVLAFLLFNLPPARLFLGDEGSLLLGYLLWLVPLAAAPTVPMFPLLSAFALLWLFPLVNSAFVIIARIRARRPLLAGDRSHLYDVLHRRIGLRRTLLTCWTVAALGATLAAALVQMLR